MYTKKLSKSTKCGTHLRSVCSLSHSLLYHGTVVKSRRRIFKRLLFYIFIETTTQHVTFYKNLMRKELGVSKLCPNELQYKISEKVPLSYQIWKRRLAFFIQGINSSADSIIMKGMVELHDMEKQYDITT